MKKRVLLCFLALIIILAPTVAFAEGQLVDLGGTNPAVSQAPAVSEAPPASQPPVSAAPEATAAPTVSAAPADNAQPSAGFWSGISEWVNDQYKNNNNFTLYVALILAGIALIIFIFVFIGYKIRTKRAARRRDSGEAEMPRSEHKREPVAAASPSEAPVPVAVKASVESVSTIADDITDTPSQPEDSSSSTAEDISKPAKRTTEQPKTTASLYETEPPQTDEQEEERLRGLDELSAAAAAFSAAVATAGAAAASYEPELEVKAAKAADTTAPPATEPENAAADSEPLHHTHSHMSRRSHTRSEMHSGHHRERTEHAATIKDTTADTALPSADSKAAQSAPDIEYNPDIVSKYATNDTDYSSAASVAAAISSIMAEARQEMPTADKSNIEEDIHVIDENSEKPFAGMHNTPYDADISRYTMQPGIDVNDVSRNTQVGFASGMKRIELGVEERIPPRTGEADRRLGSKSVGSRASRTGRRKK